jgi:hypothetical protein
MNDCFARKNFSLHVYQHSTPSPFQVPTLANKFPFRRTPYPLQGVGVGMAPSAIPFPDPRSQSAATGCPVEWNRGRQSSAGCIPRSCEADTDSPPGTNASQNPPSLCAVQCPLPMVHTETGALLPFERADMLELCLFMVQTEIHITGKVPFGRKRRLNARSKRHTPSKRAQKRHR